MISFPIVTGVLEGIQVESGNTLCPHGGYIVPCRSKSFTLTRTGFPALVCVPRYQESMPEEVDRGLFEGKRGPAQGIRASGQRPAEAEEACLY